MDKQWTFILLVTSITVCLLLLFVYQLQMNKKNKRIYVQQIDIEQKNIELLKLQNSLNINNVSFRIYSISYQEKMNCSIYLILERS